MMLSLVLNVVTLSLAAESIPEATQSWWDQSVATWVKQEALNSYHLRLNVQLDAQGQVIAVTPLSSDVSAEVLEKLVSLLKNNPPPPGSPAECVLTTDSPAVASREADMFGGSDTHSEADMFGDSPSPDIATGTDRDSAALGGSADATEDAFRDLISNAETRVEIGGRYYLRMNSSWPEGSSWNSENLDTPNLIDLYVDYRPDDHVRAYADGRLTYNFSTEDGETDLSGAEVKKGSVDLDELWLKFDAANRVYFTIGQQQLRWGTGRFWNPTDFLNPDPKDPLAVFDARTGVPLVKVHVPLESLGANVYGVVDLSEPQSLEKVGGALRAEIAAGPGEYSVSVAARKDQPLRLGTDISMSLWVFDIRAEAAFLHGVQTSYWTGKLDFDTLTFPTEKNRSDQWFPQVVAGLELPIKYNDEDSLTLGGEYFYNSLGYENADLLPWVLFNGGYKPLYFGQHYAAAYAALIGPGNWDNTTFLLSGIGNLSDQSFVTRFDARTQLRTWISVDASVSLYTGDQGEFHYTYELPVIPGILPEGLTIPANQLSYSLGAQVRF